MRYFIITLRMKDVSSAVQHVKGLADVTLVKPEDYKELRQFLTYLTGKQHTKTSNFTEHFLQVYCF